MELMAESRCLVLILVVILLPSFSNGAFLGEKCVRSSDCQTKLTECDEVTNTCICGAYTVQANHTTCLPGVLLGFECEIDDQCSIKVPISGCVNSICSCSDGYLPYRRHTCLAPAKLGDVCFDANQCKISDRGSQCKFIVPRVFGRCQCAPGRRLNPQTKKCIIENMKIGNSCEEDGDCPMSHAYCQRKLDGFSYCTCDTAYSPSADRKKCIATYNYRGLLSSTSLGYPCYAHLQCQLSDPNSICINGFCDCVQNSNETIAEKLMSPGMMCSSQNTGCHKQTFQCLSDGKCISWYFVCDGKPDCSDASDEFCTENCPNLAYQCKTGEEEETAVVKSDTLRPTSYLSPNGPKNVTCISKALLCDKIQHCPLGDDESDENCKAKEGVCPPGTFKCASTNDCISEVHFCNAISDCPGSDEEKICRKEFQPSEYCPYRCKNGLCRSTAILCSGIDGCGDNSDELNCQVCRCPRAFSTLNI